MFMIDFLQAIPFSYLALFPVLNPLGSAVIFLGYTFGLSEAMHKKLATRIAINAFFLLVAVLIAGSWILSFLGITIPVVQISGGSVLVYVGWTLLNKPSQSSNYSSTLVKSEQDAHDMAFYPLTLPLTAGPGCIAVTLTVGAHQIQGAFVSTILGLLGATLGILLAAATVFLCYRYANRLTHKLGPTGTQVILRLSAFINLCIGVQIIWKGVRTLLESVL